jgi:hypothetical protein
MLIKEDAADLQDMVEISSDQPQAKSDRTPRAAERDFKRDDDGKFATDGGGGAHNNIQPTIILNKIIRFA